MLARNHWLALVAVIGISVLPLRTDGAGECLNATTSFASTRNDPTNGDEAFFKLPSGPANVMLLVDVSGSMIDIPQCPSMGWDNGNDRSCQSPALNNPTAPTGTSKMVSVRGTCLPATDPNLSASERVPDLTDASGNVTTYGLNWMERVVPQTTYADPGRTNALLTDKAPWGTGCTGDACLFDPNAYYTYYDWNSGATPAGTYAIRRAHDTDATFAAKGCIALDPWNNYAPFTYTSGGTTHQVDLGADCRSCMTNHGFYFYKVQWVTAVNSSGVATSLSPVHSDFHMKGTFLNANPPKFVSARKVVKDIAWMDPPPGNRPLDQVRLGLTIIDSSKSSPQKARLIVPLGPDRASSFPATQAGFRQARQMILSVVNQDQTVYTDPLLTPPTIVNGTLITGGFFDPANGNTPLGSALFNIGQYFSTPGASLGTGFYGTTFNSAAETSAFVQTAAGDVNAPWVTKAPAAACSICWACQNNSVVVITDGMPNSEITFGSRRSSWRLDLNTYDTTNYTKSTNCGTGGTLCGSSLLPRVADWLHNTNVRTDMVISTKQYLNVYTVGFGLTDPTAIQVLKATANLGDSGLFQNALNAQSLGDAVYNAVMQVVPKENSFSAASANSLQTMQTAASEVFLTRFKPNETNTWEGHLFRAALFDEFLNGCDPTKAWDSQPTITCPTNNTVTFSANFDNSQDAAGNATCNGVFLIDKDCDEIVEDSTTGDFVKKSTATAANFPWDAGAVLSTTTKTGYRTADEDSPLTGTGTKRRFIFTWLGGARVELTTANVAAVKDSLNIDAAWCSRLLTQLGIAGGTDPITTCAKQIIHFVRGWDVMDADGDGCAGPGKTNLAACPSGVKGEERNRANDSRLPDKRNFYKLGDIFHSSPGVVTAPIPEGLCISGYEKQCVATLYGPRPFTDQTPLDPVTLASGKTVDAYEAYRQDNLQRPRVVLVGSNDGMLHAFDAGIANASGGLDFYGRYSYSDGTGEELWAFVPPDLLPKLKDLLMSRSTTIQTAHQYMVDGSVMVRDVWVDGGTTGAGSKDGAKQTGEFHTVAIFSERSGGTQYWALDVTKPGDPNAANATLQGDPKVLWTFPQAGSVDARWMAQSWSDFAPRPPPIGPVRIASSASRGFSERWIAMINGGYDPALDRGRAVFMVDVWTGSTLWRYTDDDFKRDMGFGSGTSMFPVTAAVGLSDVGATVGQGSMTSYGDGFFDTATWGDLGGNLFVARFFDPGKVSVTTGLVTNWHVARAFEERRRTDDLQGVAGRSEFSYMTANVYDPLTQKLRTFLGSGNRERMMDQGAKCGADNLLGCCRAGCDAVTSSTTDDYGTCNDRSSFSCTGGLYQRSTSTTAACGATASCPATGSFTSTTALSMTCPGVATATSVTGTASCAADGLCSSSPVGVVEVTSTAFTEPPRNRFYGVWSYGGPSRTFSTADDTVTEAKAFDGQRFTDVSYTGTCAGTGCTLVETTYWDPQGPLAAPPRTCTPGHTQCTASGTDPGWFYEYGRVCPMKTCPAATWNDEKTGNGSTVLGSCVVWGGFRPYGVSTSTDPCSGSVGAALTYGYTADFVTGAPNTSCGYADSGLIYRASPRSTTAPPTAATVRTTINAQGQVSYSTLNLDAGAPPSQTTTSTHSELMQPVYWLDVPRELHNCRHVAASGACE